MTAHAPEAPTDQFLEEDPAAGGVRVLVVGGAGPEASATELLAAALRYEGWRVRGVEDVADAPAGIAGFRPDAVVLHGGALGAGADSALTALRRGLPGVPVLFLVPGRTGTNRLSGLTAAGDDAVAVPFAVEDVVARVRGLVRRSPAAAAARPASVLTVGDLTLDEDSREVARGGRTVHLTATEFELLRYLMRNPRRVLSKAQILDRVWSYDFGGKANIVELYISYLRRKIDAGRPPMIHTRRGAGYLLKPGG
ncbi:DNA-binding response regulator [Streptomyces solincola]|uniref:DNA-binding response regulator n=1 Tax=Streptomyces solincola TaxID=2100817 RepID=A0A2S9PQR4_9ACTN|nr:response regulator transcription factor [Streptomyces solincola]PRH76733.1 DNA-binding response regulator [Streptomyces solincola]